MAKARGFRPVMLVSKTVSDECPFSEHPVVKYLGTFYTPDIISCPGCGRLDLGAERFHELVAQLSAEIRALRRPLKVAVMGCEVNGPGEARGADVGIAFGKNRAAVFCRGKLVATRPYTEAIQLFQQELQRTW